MMNKALFLLPAMATMAASCGPKQLALRDEPVDRAATCGVVAAAEARMAVTKVEAPLPFAAQGRIMHYAMLVASRDGRFANDRAGAVVDRMPALQAEVTDNKWQALKPACQAAFPETDPAKTVTLPANRLDAQLGCSMLGGYLASALKNGDAAYDHELASYGAMNRKLEQPIARSLRQRGAGEGERLRDAQQKALAAAATWGSPMTVMGRCVKAFG